MTHESNCRHPQWLCCAALGGGGYPGPRDRGSLLRRIQRGAGRLNDVTDKKTKTRLLRNALGEFATGVTVVTTINSAGTPVGITVNSFTSVSLDPPLVLWNLSVHSAKHAAFDDTEYFAVNVLSLAQKDVALTFARPGGEPFAGLQTEVGAGGVPLLSGCIAYFECRMVHRYRGGDHEMLVGEVLSYRDAGGEPLVFHHGRFGRFTADP